MHAKLELVQVRRIEVSAETVAELETLLAEAKSGALTGLAYVALHQGADYSVNARGRARFAPTHTIGAIESLKQFLSRLL